VSRLLILGCSARKRGGPEPVEPLERYDGPMWRIVRHYLASEPLFGSDLEIWALSAEFGLVGRDEQIPMYERLMDERRAHELRPGVTARLAKVIRPDHKYVCLAVSERYMTAIEGVEGLLPDGARVTITNGTAGVKLAQLKAWLGGRDWQPRDDLPMRLEGKTDGERRMNLCGVTVRATPDEVFEVARRGIERGERGVRLFRDWYVQVDGKRVSPKWLVSKLSGVPTSRFDAGDARRVLVHLGIDVERVV
jgi:hypothetical protein